MMTDMLKQVAENEALQRALVTSGIGADLRVARMLREQPLMFFETEMHNRIYGPLTEEAFAAICTYVAVRWGQIVMREETADERADREDDQAYAVHG